MKSPQEVAMAKSDFLDELETRVGRFARGADLSTRYARELHHWLAVRHSDDERFDRVLAVLRDYPSRVGQADARDVCRQLLGTVRRRSWNAHFGLQSTTLLTTDARTAPRLMNRNCAPERGGMGDPGLEPGTSSLSDFWRSVVVCVGSPGS
jgi:hypothetical protein